MSRKVLVISYLFPPVGGSGVQRASKFVKYLPEFGWHPVVLTVKKINYHVYDYALLQDLPSEARIIRTESLDPQRLTAFLFKGSAKKPDTPVVLNARFREGSAALDFYRLVRDAFAFPDAVIGWIPFAYSAGVRAVRENKIDAIIALMPPHSSAFLAEMISKATGVPYVLDLRDSWTDDPDFHFMTRLHKKGHALLEKRAIERADAVTVFGEQYKRILSRRYPHVAARVDVLTNGFDVSDLQGIVPKELTGKYRIVYSGSLNYYHEPTFRALLAALRSLPAELRDSIELMFIGRSSLRAQQEIVSAGLHNLITFIPYLPHREALSYLRSASASLLFIPKGDVASFTGKVFEYLMVGHPIIACIEPQGACAEVLRRAGHGNWITPPEDSEGLRQAISALATAGWPRPSFADVDQFNRRRITERLAGILDRIVAERAVKDRAEQRKAHEDSTIGPELRRHGF